MKLVDILARELKVWPCLGRKLCQGHKGHIYPTDGGDTYAITERAEDWELADVTRDEWQAAVDAPKAEKVVEWSGEGLPPVGTVCEYGPYQLSGDWQQVEIIAHFRNKAMVAAFIPTGDGGKTVAQAIAECFRPIRTPEQIAAQEQEKGILQMAHDCGSWWQTETDTKCLPPIFAVMWKAGYRKFEIVEGE